MATSTPGATPSTLTQEELLSISLRYPEINFDSIDATMGTAATKASENDSMSRTSPEANSAPDSVESSPSSHHDQDNDESRITDSTARTTPLKHLMFREPVPQTNPYKEYLGEVDRSDLPNATKSYLRCLASEMVRIGALLHDSFENDSDASEESNKPIHEGMSRLVKMMQTSANNCNDQTSTITWLTELAIFAVVPTDVALWSVYRQRVILTTK
jgi:hypothetical protein